MARKAKKRTLSVKILLTDHAYKQVSDSAFKNCRTVSQELTFMIERQIVDKKGPVKVLAKYEDQEPSQNDTRKYDEIPNDPVKQEETNPSYSDWTQEQEAEVFEKFTSAGMSPAQITAARLMYKTPEAVLESLKENSTE